MKLYAAFSMPLQLVCSFTDVQVPLMSNEQIVLVASLYGVVESPSLFIRYLIGRTGKIWSVVFINAKWIYTYETISCTIIECEIVRSVLHATSTCLFIYWCSGAANVKWTLQVWYSCLNSVEVNCVTASEKMFINPTIQIRQFSQI